MIKPLPPYKEFCPEHGILEGCQSCGNGNLLHYDLIEWCPDSNPKAAIVCIHAMFLSAKAYADFGNQFSKRGYHVYAMDIRGFGRKRNQSGFNLVDFQRCIDDIKRLIVYLKRINPDLPIILVGESMGGAITLKLVSQLSHLLDAIACSAPAWQLFEVPRVTYYGLIDKITGEPGKAANWVLENATSCEELKKYWKEEGSTRLKLSIKEAYAYLNLMNSTPSNAEKINSTPTLILQGLNDKLSKPEASINLYHHLKTPTKNLLLSTEKEHVLLEENQLTSPIIDHLEHWIQYQLASRKKVENLEPVTIVGDSKLPAQVKELVDAISSKA